MLAPTTKIISSLSIKASRVTVPCQTIMTAPTSFAITSSFPGSHRVPTPLTLKRPVMAAPTSLKIGVATHSAGRDFFRRTASPARSHSRTRDTPAPRRDRALPPASCRAAHSRIPTSPTPLQRPHRLCRLGARAFSAATVRVDDELPQPTPSPSLLNTAAALLAYKRSNAVTSPVTSPSTPSRFAPLAEPLLPSPAHSRDEAPTIGPLPRAVPRQGEMAGSSPDH